MKYIFVDGYNVINYWPELRNMKEYSYETARQKLIEILTNYAVYKDCKMFLVFDAHNVKGSIEKQENFNNTLYVIYTKEGETADCLIEKRVNNIGRKAEVSVVTSDSLEQQTIFQRGAIRMSCMEFYSEVRKVENNIKTKIEKKYDTRKNRLEDSVKKEILDKLEKIRRGH